MNSFPVLIAIASLPDQNAKASLENRRGTYVGDREAVRTPSMSDLDTEIQITKDRS